MADAEELADRVGLLADGGLLAVDSPAALVREFGGESLLRIETAGSTDAEGGGTPRSVPDLGYPADLEDGRLTVRGVAPEEIGTVVDRLDAAGVGYESLTWTEPDLEDVYLELTGRRVTASGDALRREEVRA
jgi:ABC-2 type transport system ATP-binding protein